jgi:hypothetical protein
MGKQCNFPQTTACRASPERAPHTTTSRIRTDRARASESETRVRIVSSIASIAVTSL